MQFKSLAAVVGLSVMSFFASNAHAAGTGSGRISATVVEGTQYARIYVYGSHSSKPACATSGMFALDISTNKGKAMFSAILAAALAGRVVEVIGNDNANRCDLIGTAETMTKLTFWTDDF